MPPIPRKKKRKRKLIQVDDVPKRNKWECPLCGAVHHFDARDGCHAHCGYSGRLRRIR